MSSEAIEYQGMTVFENQVQEDQIGPKPDYVSSHVKNNNPTGKPYHGQACG